MSKLVDGYFFGISPHLPSVVDGQVHVLPPAPALVELDEALGAEEVHAVLAEHRGVVMLALETYVYSNYVSKSWLFIGNF